jgi:hypothetical protein
MYIYLIDHLTKDNEKEHKSSVNLNDGTTGRWKWGKS